MYRYPVEGLVVSSDQTSKLHVDILTIFIEYPKNTTLAQKETPCTSCFFGNMNSC